MHRLEDGFRELSHLEDSLDDFADLDVDLSRLQAGEGLLDIRIGSIPADNLARLRDVLALLAPGGSLIFSTNLRRFRLDREGLEREVPGLSIDDVSRRTLPKDFERNPRIHQCFMIRRDEPAR